MNAAPPVFQAQPSNDAAQPNAPTSAASATTRTGSQGFAAALSDAGGKPVRKSAANKQQNPSSSGGSLPAPGNQPPLAPKSPPPAKTDVSAAKVADATAIAKDTPGSAPGSVPSEIAAASAAVINGSGATTILTAASLDPAPPPAAAAPPGISLPPGSAAPSGAAAPPGFAAAPDIAAPSGVAAAPATEVGVDATTVPGSMSMPHAPSMRTLAAPGTSTAATAPAAASANTGTAKPSGAAANAATMASANSAPASTDPNAPNDATLSDGPAAAGTDAAAQAVMAAAIAQGTSAPAPNTSSFDDSAVPDIGVPQGAAVPSDGTAAPAAALARASAAAISAAATTAAAAGVTQALSDAAGAADKRSHTNSPDAPLSGASNDGGVGAAQLLTTNTSTDSAPTPTFKVAAGVDTAQFGQGVADRVVLMTDGNLTSAKLQVNPPALGPIEVRIALQGGHAQVSFSSHSAVTRDALESSSEKLREMLGSQGFSSVSVDISQRSFQERSPPSQAYETAPSIRGDAPVLAQAALSMPRGASGLLDAYA